MATLGSAEFIIGANISRLNSSLTQANKMIGRSFAQAAVTSSKILSTSFNSGFGSAVVRATKQLSSMRSVVGTSTFALGLTTAASSMGAIALAGPNLLLTFKTLKDLVSGTPALVDIFSVYYFKEVIKNLTGVVNKWQLLNAQINVVKASLQAVINAQQYMGTSLNGQALQGPTLATMWDPGTGVQLFAAMEEYELRMRAIRTASGDTNKEVDRLLGTIRQQSKASQTVVIDLAQTANEMVNLGFTSTEAAKALRAVRQAATTTGETTATVATSIKRVLEGFNLDASNTQRVADLLAKIKLSGSLASVSLNSLATGLQRTGAIASQTGQSLEDMTVTLALMNSTGKAATASGDRIAKMLLSLQEAARSNSTALQELGLGYGQLISSDGSSLRSMVEIIPLIKKATTGLDPGKSQGLLENILGGKENAIAMIELLSRSNEQIDQLIQKASNATGFNANIVAETNQGVAAAMSDLQYRIGAVSEIVGDTYAPLMEWATNATGDLLNVFLKFPPVLQQSIVQWGILLGIYKLFFGYSKLYLYWTKASALATKAWTFAQQENATQLAVLKAQTIGQTIVQKAQAVQQSINARITAVTTGAYTKQALAADFITLKTRAATVAQTAFAASQKTSLAATQLLWKTLTGSIAAASGAILLFQGATERTEGAKQAIKLKEATRELAASYQEISSELDTLSSDYDSFWQGIGESAISTFNRIQKEGLVKGSRDSLALLLESEGNRIEEEISQLEKIEKKRKESFGGKFLDELLRFGRGGRSASDSLQPLENVTDTSSDYGNQRGFSTTAQLGNIKIIQQLEATQRRLNDSFQAGIDLRSKQNITNEDFIKRARPLVELYEKEITAIKAVKVETEAQQIAKQNLLKPIEDNRDALIRRIYAIENGIELNKEFALSFKDISAALKEESSAIDTSLATTKAAIAEARANSELSTSLASKKGIEAEREALESRVQLYQEKLEQLSAAIIGANAEQTEEIKKLQAKLSADLLSARQDLAEKRIAIGQREVESIEGEYDKQSDELEFFHQRAIANTKKALAQQKIDRADYNKFILDLDKTALVKREELIGEEFKLLDEALNDGRITREQHQDREQELLNESVKLVQEKADLEIKLQQEIIKAYNSKLSIMNEEISLQKSLNELALTEAEGKGATELELGEIKIEQLRKMQELQRNQFELQLAQNLASAEDVELQRQLNKLALKRFDVNAEKEIKQAQLGNNDLIKRKDEEARRRKIDFVKEEAKVRQIMNELALVEAEAAGASDIELGRMKLEQLKQIQEMKRQELELQLAQNLASAEDVESQRQLNKLLRQQFEANVEKDIKQNEEELKKSRVDRIKEEADIRSQSLQLETDAISQINELRSQELDLIDQAKSALETKASVIEAEENATISSLNQQLDLAGELLNMQAKGAEAEKIRGEIASELGLNRAATEIQILEKKRQIEAEIGQAKEMQMVRQHELQDQLLAMEAQQNTLNAEQALSEAQINQLKAQQAILEAQSTVATLKAEGADKRRINAALTGVQLAEKSATLTQSQSANAKEQLKVIGDQNAARQRALDIQQATEASELSAANAVADRAGRLAIATAKAKSNSEGMADAMGRAADNAGKAADAMGRAAEATEKSFKGGRSRTTSVRGEQDLPDLKNIEQRQRDVAIRLAEASGNAALAETLKAQAKSEKHKAEIKALHQEALELSQARAQYRKAKNNYINTGIENSRELTRSAGIANRGLVSGKLQAGLKRSADSIFGTDMDLTGGKSDRLLQQALAGFNPSQVANQYQADMKKSFQQGNKGVEQRLDLLNTTMQKGLSQPREITINGSTDTGGDLEKVLGAMKRAQRSL